METLQRQEGENYRHFRSRQLFDTFKPVLKNYLKRKYKTWKKKHEGDLFDFVAVEFHIW